MKYAVCLAELQEILNTDVTDVTTAVSDQEAVHTRVLISFVNVSLVSHLFLLMKY